jgi:hypothetical protein
VYGVLFDPSKIFLIIYYVPVIVSSVIWRLLIPSIAYRITSHAVGKTVDRQIFLGEEPKPFEFNIRRILSMSVYPFLFLFSSATFYMDWMGYISPQYDAAINIAVLSTFLLPTISVFIVPLIWVFDLSGIKCYSEKYFEIQNLKDATITRFFTDFVSVSAFLALLNLTLKNIQLTNWFVVTILYLYPISLLLTSIYLSTSINCNVAKFTERLEKHGVLTKTRIRVITEQKNAPH